MENRRENFSSLLAAICDGHRESKDDLHQHIPSEPFSFIRFILLIGESINYMTSSQKDVDWLPSFATFLN